MGVDSDIGLPVLADNANHVVIGGGSAKTIGGAAMTIAFGGAKAMLFLLVGTGVFALRRRAMNYGRQACPSR